jgi:hypothetical protein
MKKLIKKIVGRMKNRQSGKNCTQNNNAQCTGTERRVVRERRIQHARNMNLIHFSVCEL